MSIAPRVLITTSVYPRWNKDATPAFIQNLSQDLASHGFDVRVLAPHFRGAALESREDDVSIRRIRYAIPESLQCLCYEGGMIVRLREKKWRSALLPSFAITHFLAIKRELKKFRPHIVHAHSLLPQGWLTAKALGKDDETPLVVSSHGNDVFGLQGRFEKWKKQTATRANVLVANSRTTRDALTRIAHPDKIETIHASPNQISSAKKTETISLRRKLGGDKKKLILFAGRLIPEKGIDLLLEILPAILKDSPDAKLIISGDGPLADAATSHIQNVAKKGTVEYLGWTPNDQIPKLFSSVDLVAVPSQPQGSGWSEAQGLVAVEAMAAGKPVIASNIGGLAESTIDQETGFLVEPSDRSAWIETITKVLNSSPDQRKAWGDAGQKRYLVNYSREANLEKTKSLYNRLLKKVDI